VAEADSVMVMINYKTGEKSQIDDDNRKKLEAFA
jgi:acyl-CoA thioesterase FadM